VIDDFDDTGNVLTTASFVMGTTATLYLILDFFIRPADFGFSIIRSAIFIMLGLAMGIIAQKKFKLSLKYPTFPKVGIIANAVSMVFVIIVSFFHFLY
jgi:hypothetical protein